MSRFVNIKGNWYNPEHVAAIYVHLVPRADSEGKIVSFEGFEVNLQLVGAASPIQIEWFPLAGPAKLNPQNTHASSSAVEAAEKWAEYLGDGSTVHVDLTKH